MAARKNVSHGVRTVGISICIVACFSASALAQSQKTWTVGDYNVVATAVEDFGHPVAIVVTSPLHAGVSFTLNAMDDPEDLDLRLYGSGRLFIFDPRHWYVLDLEAGVVVDSSYYLSDQLWISPDNRYVAFERNTPNGVTFVDCVYLVYDMSQSAAANHMAQWSNGGSSGLAMYPPENRTTGAYHLATTEVQAHRRASPMVWLSNTQLAFVDNLTSTITAVLVDLSQGATAAIVHEVTLDPTTVVYPLQVPNNIFPAEGIDIESIQRISTANGLTVRLGIGYQPWRRVESIDVTFVM